MNIKQKWKETKNTIIPIAIATMAAYFGASSRHQYDSNNYNTLPIQESFADVNKDGIEDRVYQSEAGLRQIHFGVMGPNDTITYKNLKQLRIELYEEFQEKGNPIRDEWNTLDKLRDTHALEHDEYRNLIRIKSAQMQLLEAEYFKDDFDLKETYREK